MGNEGELKADMIIQYSIVGIILLAALGWIIWKMWRNNKKKDIGSCCGCSLSENCRKKDIIHKTDNCSNNQ